MIATTNPHSNELVKEFETYTPDQIESTIAASRSAFEEWRTSSFETRSTVLGAVAELLREREYHYAELITEEMGKPIVQSQAEIEKCAVVCDYYASQGPGFLADEHIATEAQQSYIGYDPLGVVLAVMPWNFPFWQVLRFAAPAIMAGNGCLLKHASNVPQCALAIEKLFVASGAPQGLFGTLLVESSAVEGLIADPRIAAITLTGSEQAGTKVAEIAARHIKKVVLELGGSDPLIVLSDADLGRAARTAIKSRMVNAGQSCIAAKRFIVVDDVANEFVTLLGEEMEKLTAGDPSHKQTQIGPMARADLADELQDQVERTMEAGATIAFGGQGRDGAFYPPTILDNVTKGSPAYSEELFGPVASIIRVGSENEAVAVANSSDFGLGASIWTRDLEKGAKMARQIESGSVFVNGLVKSDARLPFGGVKRSGYGRELGYLGIREFCNIKTIVIDE